MFTPFCNNPNASIIGNISVIGNKAVMTKKNTRLLYSYVTIKGPRNLTIWSNDITFYANQLIYIPVINIEIGHPDCNPASKEWQNVLIEHNILRSIGSSETSILQVRAVMRAELIRTVRFWCTNNTWIDNANNEINYKSVTIYSPVVTYRTYND